MDPLDLLALAAAEFRIRVDAVTDDDWDRPTPCTDWTVGDLVDHVIGGNLFTVRMLAGDPVEDAMAAARAGVADLPDRIAKAHASADAQHAAFAAPGALGRICHHPAGDLLGNVVLGFRVTDLSVHAWDLARGIGADGQLDPRLVEAVWTQLSAEEDAIAVSGLFGDGPSGTTPDDAPLQDRMLDLTGRRP